MGFVLVILGVICFIIGLVSQVASAMQQTVQYLIFVCSAIMVSGGFVCITIQFKDHDVSDVRKLSGKLDELFEYMKKTDDERERKARYIALAEAIAVPPTGTVKIEKYDDMLDDPAISTQSDLMLELYGKDTMLMYLAEKRKLLKI